MLRQQIFNQILLLWSFDISININIKAVYTRWYLHIKLSKCIITKYYENQTLFDFKVIKIDSDYAINKKYQ